MFIIYLTNSAPPDTPSVTLTSTGSGSSYDPITDIAVIIQGQNSTFTCAVTSADEEADVMWILDNSVTSDATELDAALESVPDCNSPVDTETYSFTADHANHHGQPLQCKASNSANTIGTTDSINLDVHGKKYLINKSGTFMRKVDDKTHNIFPPM